MPHVPPSGSATAYKFSRDVYFAVNLAFSRFFQGSPHKTISRVFFSPSPRRRLSIIDHKDRQRDTACCGFSNVRRFTSRSMYRNCAQSAVQNELKTDQFQRSGHAHLPETTATSGAANAAAY